MSHDYLVVGAGVFGCVIAERIANVMHKRVLIIDKLPHIGGNCYSEIDSETGIEYHVYGTHIFHTSSKKVWEYINRFTDFNNYHHQVLSMHKRKVYQMPINLETINSFFNSQLRPFEVKEFLAGEIGKEYTSQASNLEEMAVNSIGRSLYEAFIKNYTMKQWGKSPTELPPSIISRLPVRYNYREDYFLDDRWQGIPLEGYTRLFERLIDSPNIILKLNCDFFENRELSDKSILTVYSGPIDRFFGYTIGKLEWRSVRFVKESLPYEDFQGTSVMNYADGDVSYTRIHEPRHLHPERSYSNNKTLVIYEYPSNKSENGMYPVNTPKNMRCFLKYREMASKIEHETIIGGRLGDYAYYDMDKAILSALNCFEQKIM